MTPIARFAAAAEVLDRWLGGTPAERALTDWARGARYAGSGDRAAVRDHVYEVLRRYGTCRAAAGFGEDEPQAIDGRALILGLVRLGQRDPANVFTGEGHALAPLSAAERAREPLDFDPERNVPAWLRPALKDRFGAAYAAFLDTQGVRAPVWLRVNLRRARRDEVVAALVAERIEATGAESCTTAIMVSAGERKLRQATAYCDGLVEPQDLSVQIAIAETAWPLSGKILDYCAGGGGKALALADRTDARVYAHDAVPRRMADLQPRADRAGVRITELSTDALDREGPFDLVLTDVPCSGSGTWRRDPEAKWRLTPERLEELITLQAEILDAAARLVGPGGRLVYMTCSLLRAENEAQIDSFHDRHSGWQTLSNRQDTPLTASDGFFSATLSRSN
ncbi:RsmB/NOP family class I SAM-dependent RNA methyltransferase [Rhodobacterales bacterium HKCCE4037]|nr:RsmB/NOP family class I SAM-dependent RNA methyltransferase [Rhodobacterales bacterium HKCCE4037]